MYGLNNYVVNTTVSSFTATEVYKRFLAERDCILENKWYMSEREGKDVGFERALLDWVLNHRTKWVEKFRSIIF